MSALSWILFAGALVLPILTVVIVRRSTAAGSRQLVRVVGVVGTCVLIAMFFLSLGLNIDRFR